MAIRITYTGPELSGRGMSRAARAAMDAGLQFHRKTHLPRHFKREALSRYPNEYAAACPQRDKRGRVGNMLKKELAEMTAGERKRFWSERQRNRKRYEKASRQYQQEKMRNLDRENEIPLFKTGRLQGSVLQGFVAFRLPAARREMVFNPPFYTYFKTRNKKGVFDKVLAIQAVRADEENAFAREVDKGFQSYFDGRK